MEAVEALVRHAKNRLELDYVAYLRFARAPWEDAPEIFEDACTDNDWQEVQTLSEVEAEQLS
jgi:hypothetical protein